MPITKVKAKRDYLPFFKKGEKMKIVPILYDKDVLLLKAIYGVFNKKNVCVRYLSQKEKEQLEKEGSPNVNIQKVFSEVWAKKGTYKDSYIVKSDGKEFPSTLLGMLSYQEVFEKI